MKLFRLLVRNDFYAKLTARKGWIRQVNSEWNEVEYPNLRYAEGCHKYPETVSAALLDDHSKACIFAYKISQIRTADVRYKEYPDWKNIKDWRSTLRLYKRAGGDKVSPICMAN